MEVSNTLVANVTIKHLIKDIWLNTRGQYMKESNTLQLAYMLISQPLTQVMRQGKPIIGR